MMIMRIRPKHIAPLLGAAAVAAAIGAAPLAAAARDGQQPDQPQRRASRTVPRNTSANRPATSS